mgnify:CR=1 FL=1
MPANGECLPWLRKARGSTVQRAPASNPYDLLGRSAGIEVHQQGQGPGFASNVVIGGLSRNCASCVKKFTTSRRKPSTPRSSR